MPITVAATRYLTFLTDTFTVKRPTITSDGAGGGTEVLPSGTSVSGRMRPRDLREAAASDRLTVDYTHMLYLPAGTTIQRGDYVVDAASARFRVVDVLTSPGGHHLRARCKAEVVS